MKVPTDYAILNDIYDHYYEQFAKGSRERDTKNYVPVDIGAIAKRLGVDKDIVFGRLYYYLQEKHGFTREDNVKVPFFARAIGHHKDCIHFPLLGSVLAGMREERLRNLWTVALSILSLILAAVSLLIQFQPSR